MIQETVAREIKRILAADIDVAFNVPPKREFGDFSTAVCLGQAGTQKRAPMAIAQELAEKLARVKLPFVAEVIVTPPGYLNFRIDHPRFAEDMIGRVRRQAVDFGGSGVGRGRKILIEHTNVNPNKAMHIGHLRNAIIGDSVVRILRKLSYNVEACNYIDDTGVQVADVVVGMLYMDEPVYSGSGSLDAIWDKWDKSQSFDYWCWDLYSRVANAYDSDPALAARRAEILHHVEAQNSEIARFAKEVATKIVHAHLATVSRLNVFYDLLNWESDIFLRGFWTKAFELLKESGAVVYETEGPNKGCWVVRFGRGVVQTDEGVKSQDKILVRSNGTVTYTGKDVAYQMWKFGALGVDFLFEQWGKQANGVTLWTTAPDGKPKPEFGHADRVINVIDVRQSYPQQVVYDCLRKVGYRKQAANSKHLDYEVVVLSNAAAAELGVDVDADEAGTQAMSGRKGIGVKGDDLLNTLIQRLREKITNEKSAAALAAAAVRYYMSKTSTGKMIVFDFDEALRSTGDTGVYCEYAHARACSILKKAGKISFRGVRAPENVTATEEALLKKVEELPSVMKTAGKELTPAPLAHYAFELATVFTDFYENPDPGAEKQTPFIKITDPALKKYRLALVDTFRQAMANCLNALGIQPLEQI